MNYIGPSMNPTLRSGDRLDVIPCKGQEIRRGDVVVFTPPGGDSNIIHRVVSISSQGIRTRGDKCSQIDEWVLRRENIVGRVVYAERGNKRRRVLGGLSGQLFAATLSAFRATDSAISSVLRPAYAQLARNGRFRRWLPTKMKIKVISFERADGTELQLLMGRRVIGRWLPGMPRWHIRRPFRMFVDEEALPKNKTEVSGVPPTLC